MREITEFVRVVIPDKVMEECSIKGSTDSILIIHLVQQDCVEVRKINDKKAVHKLQHDFRIGKGEAEALWLSKEMGIPLATDDGRAIKASKVTGKKFLTAIHFLLDLVLKGSIDRNIALEKLQTLATYGRYSKRIITDAMTRIQGGPI